MDCAPLADDLERWLIREVDDFERLTPLQSLVLDAWAVLTLAAERVAVVEGQDEIAATDQVLAESDSKTAGAAPIRDMAAAPVVVEARRGLTPPTSAAPATGWSNPSSLPSKGWTTHLDATELPSPPGVGGGVL